jgi:multidrug efflux pump subunit AcrA (membrane-fusion protein)
VKISVPSLGVERTSVIKRVGQYINPNNRTFKIRVEVPNEDQMLKPNLVALIQVNDYNADTTVVLPTNLVMEGFGNQQYVFVVRDSAGFKVARKQAIETGLSYEGQTEITKGLTGNETIVNKGARSIKNGELVEIAQ